MNYEEFIFSLHEDKPPAEINQYLTVLWYDSKGKWDVAHKLAQSIYNNHGSLLHAYLHRKEGDLANAAYWYSNTNAKMPVNSLKEEWEELVHKYLTINEND